MTNMYNLILWNGLPPQSQKSFKLKRLAVFFIKVPRTGLFRVPGMVFYGVWGTIISSELHERPYQIVMDLFQSLTNGSSSGGLFRSLTENLIRVSWTAFTQSSTDGFYKNSGDGLFWTLTDGIGRVPRTALSSNSHGWPFSEFDGRVIKTLGANVKNSLKMTLFPLIA